MVRASLLVAGALAAAYAHSISPERAVANDNRASAGTLRNGVLTLRLEVRETVWHPDGDGERGIGVYAFAEPGKPASVPGPLVRVPVGTTVHAIVHNPLRDSTLTIGGLSTRGAVSFAEDTSVVRVAPGETREVRFVAGTPGTYRYWGTMAAGGQAARAGANTQLDGAFVVDAPGAAGRPPDRVMVISLWVNQRIAGGVVPTDALVRWAINGRSWPNTERLTHTVGDSVRYRVINASGGVHPMHLHGFYFNVDSRGDGSRDTTYDARRSPRLVVTERLAPGRTMAMTWVPERAGYWLFHCHDNAHTLRNAPLDGSALPAEHTMHTRNHATEMMGGLVMGVEVRPKRTTVARASRGADAGTRRALRLVAREDTGGTEREPAYGYELHDGIRVTPNASPLVPGPTIVLERGKPVAITVVNRLREPTAVHWHGIELDSYYDGVADFSGHPGRVAPAIAPGDSFVARFTPPRSGTFMYHPHADEVRQQMAGLSGVIVVTDDVATYDAERDLVFLLATPRRIAERGTSIYLNGSASPTARELRVGQPYRVRVANLHTARPSMIVQVLRDSVPVTWRALAKDGMTLPADQATVRPARQQLGNGEAYDFELAADAPGDLRFLVTTGNGVPLASMALRVRP